MGNGPDTARANPHRPPSPSSADQVSDVSNVMRPVTRWGELQTTLKSIVHLLLVVDHVDGFSLKFLNDPTWCVHARAL